MACCGDQYINTSAASCCGNPSRGYKVHVTDNSTATSKCCWTELIEQSKECCNGVGFEPETAVCADRAPHGLVIQVQRNTNIIPFPHRQTGRYFPSHFCRRSVAPGLCVRSLWPPHRTVGCATSTRPVTSVPGYRTGHQTWSLLLLGLERPPVTSARRPRSSSLAERRISARLRVMTYAGVDFIYYLFILFSKRLDDGDSKQAEQPRVTICLRWIFVVNVCECWTVVQPAGYNCPVGWMDGWLVCWIVDWFVR